MGKADEFNALVVEILGDLIGRCRAGAGSDNPASAAPDLRRALQREFVEDALGRRWVECYQR